VSGPLGSLMRGTLIYGFGQALGRSMTLLLLPVLTAYLDPASYGILAVLTAFGLLLNTVFSVGLGAATAPSYFEAEHKGATIWTAFAILCASTAIMVALGIAGSSQMSRLLLGNASDGNLVLLTVGATAFSILSLPLRQFLMFEERPGLYISFSIGSLVASLALTVWLVVGLGRGVTGVLEADMLAQAVTCLLFALPVIRHSTVDVRRKLARELIALGLPLIPAFGSVFVLQHGSRYLLQWLVGPEQVGVYAVGVNIAAALGLLVAGFQSAWMPYFMRYSDRRDEARQAFGRVATYYTLTVGSASLLLYLFARPAVEILSGPAYHGAESVIGLAATAQFLSGSFVILIPGLYFAREVKYVGGIQALAAAAVVVLNLLLVPPFGYVGSAVAVLVSYLLLNAGQFWWNRRRGYLDVAYDWRRLRRFGALYVGFALISFTPRDLPLAIECVVATAAAGALALAVWRLLTPDERAVLRTWVGRRPFPVTGEAAARIGRGI
jgi:O-antigen/teichoic acid export membrane protein